MATVGDFRKAIEGLADDVPVCVVHSDKTLDESGIAIVDIQPGYSGCCYLGVHVALGPNGEGHG